METVLHLLPHSNIAHEQTLPHPNQADVHPLRAQTLLLACLQQPLEFPASSTHLLLRRSPAPGGPCAPKSVPHACPPFPMHQRSCMALNLHDPAAPVEL